MRLPDRITDTSPRLRRPRVFSSLFLAGLVVGVVLGIDVGAVIAHALGLI